MNSKKFLLILLIIFCLVYPDQGILAAIKIDTDQDGLLDEVENKLGTNPDDKDSDGDGYVDGVEVANGFNPLAGNRNRQVKRTVEVNLSKQQLKYVFNGVEVATAPVSTGVPGLDTPVGEYKIMRKLPTHRYIGLNYDYKNTKWNLEFKRGFYLHGAYWHNQFGVKPMSHGCINIAYKDAEKVYKFLDVGDQVKIYGKTPRGKLAKS